jgi:CheY-like chemotaxis protein
MLEFYSKRNYIASNNGTDCMNILVVDDDPAYRELLGTFFRMQGWSVITASDGLEGLQRLSETTIDCIVSDIYMPNMDGLKFHNQVREASAYSTIPFLFVSGYSDQGTLTAISKTKSDGFFQKTQPLSLLKEWVQYLTTPEGKRVSAPPTEKQSATQYQRTRDLSQQHKRR